MLVVSWLGLRVFRVFGYWFLGFGVWEVFRGSSFILVALFLKRKGIVIDYLFGVGGGWLGGWEVGGC